MPKILVIDDDSTFLSALTTLIMNARPDIAIDTALCAEAGLLLIGIAHYDAIISDFRLSGLDGLRLLKECKRLRPGTPLVLLTGHGDRELETEALNMGAYAFIHKPAHPHAVLSLVNRTVRKVVPLSSEHHEIRERVLEKVQEMNRRIQQQLKSLGSETIH